MPVAPQMLYVRARYSVLGMSLHSFRNNSRSLYNYCAFSRTGESVVCDGAAAVLKNDAGTPPRLRETKQATGDFVRSAVKCDASSHRFSRLASPYSPQPGLRSRRWSSRSDAGFNPVAREVTSRAATDPNIMFYPFFCRRAQVEIDPRIRPGRFYRDGGTYFAGYQKGHFVHASRQRNRVMAADIRAADNRRDRRAFLLKTDFGVFERPAVGADDITLDGGGLRWECC